MSFTETEFSSLARSDAGSQNEYFSNGTINVKKEADNQPARLTNGVLKAAIKTSQMGTAAVAAPSNDPPKVPSLPENRESMPKD